jgi:hypothetical protein
LFGCSCSGGCEMQRTDAASPLHDNEAGVTLPTEAAVEVAAAAAAAAAAAEASAKPTDPIGDDMSTTALRPSTTEPAAAASPAWAMSLEEMERQLYDPSLVSRYFVNATKAERAKMRQLPPRMARPWIFDNDLEREEARNGTLTANATSTTTECATAALKSTAAKGTHQDQCEPSSVGSRWVPDVSNHRPNEDVRLDANVPQIDLDYRQAAATALRHDEAKGEEEPQSWWSREGSGATNASIESGDVESTLERDKPTKRQRSKDRERRRSRSGKKSRKRKKRDRRGREHSNAHSIRTSDDDASNATSASEASRSRKKQRKKGKRRHRQHDDSNLTSVATKDA